MEDGLIAFTKTLTAWDGQPLAHLVVQNEMPVVRLLNQSNERLIISLFIFALVLLLLIYWSVVRWVSHPLRQIMDKLEAERPETDRATYARTTPSSARWRGPPRKFFEQRDNLMREMEERRATEEALAQERRRTAAFAKDGSGRPAGRRRRSRFQQPSHRDHRLCGVDRDANEQQFARESRTRN